MEGFLRGLIDQLDVRRRGSRPDVARELSLAITHLEDAHHRINLADIRDKRHPADAATAVRSAEPVVVGTTPEDETTSQED